MKRIRNTIAGLALLTAAAALLPVEPAAAQGRGPIACGTLYAVVRGDTLHDIAVRAYGTGNFRAIFDANRGVLRSVSVIEVGDRLLVPCLDGTGFRTREEALAALAPGVAPGGGAVPGGAVAAPAATALLARILVLAEAAPFAGRRLPEGGMVTELVSRAMLRAPSAVDYEVVFEDAGALGARDIAARGFDLGFPATRPDCARAAQLTAEQRARCTGFVYSAPIAEIDTRVYVRAGSELAEASDPGQLAGLRICRPAGGLLGELAEGDLVEPHVTLVPAPHARACLESVRAGETDAAVLSGPSIDAAIARAGAAEGLREVALLRRTRPIHVVAPRGNQRGEAFLATLDRGLAEIRASGEWQAVVDNHLGQQAASF